MNVHSARGALGNKTNHTAAASKRSARSAIDRREALLKAALTLFADRGYDGVAAPELAGEAGVGVGTIYRYFRSKRALANELYRLCKSEFYDYLVRNFDEAEPLREQFRRFYLAMAAFRAERPLIFRFLELQDHRSYLDSRSEALMRETLGFVQAFVVRAVAAGAIRPLPPDFVTAITLGAFVGLVKSEENGQIKINRRTLEEAEECAWRAIALETADRGRRKGK